MEVYFGPTNVVPCIRPIHLQHRPDCTAISSNTQTEQRVLALYQTFKCRLKIHLLSSFYCPKPYLHPSSDCLHLKFSFDIVHLINCYYYYYYYYYKSLKWHYHIKDVAGTLYKIKEKKNVCEAQIVQLLTVSGNVQRLPISRNTTTGTECAFVSCRNCSSELAARVAGGSHYRLELLPLEMPGRRGWNVL